MPFDLGRDLLLGHWDPVLDEPPETRVHTMARLLMVEDVIGELIDCLDDIFDMSPGPTQYDAHPWAVDIGVSRGFSYTASQIKVQLTEKHPTEVVRIVKELGENPSLIAAVQHQPDQIVVFIWDYVQLYAMDLDVPWRGEAMSTPVMFSARGGRIITQR